MTNFVRGRSLNRVTLLLIFVACLSIFASMRAQAAKPRVLIVKTRDSAFYNPMAEGILAGLKMRGFRAGEQIDLTVIALVGKADEDTKQVHGQMSKRTDLVLAIGTDAALLVAKEKTDIPALFGMILDPVSMGLVKSSGCARRELERNDPPHQPRQAAGHANPGVSRRA